MTQTRRKSARALGFTLIELLIVVIILAILAAIVVPQFANTTVDAKEATLDANLATVRGAIEQYKVQHSVYPAVTAATSTTTPTCTTPGTGLINTSQALIDQLTLASDKNGNTCSLADPVNFKFGPYLRQKLPNEPINEKGSVAAEVAISTTGAKIAPTAATGGWAYDNKSGEFVMNSNAKDSKTVIEYFKH